MTVEPQSNMRLVRGDQAPVYDTEPPTPQSDWDRMRQAGLIDMKANLEQAHKNLEAADNWAQTLAAVPSHIKPMITDLHRKVARIMIEVKDLK